jgi:hypothetical protein
VSSLLIVQPYRIAVVSGSGNLGLMATPDPKEAGVIAGGSGSSGSLHLDMGVAVSVDTLFIGYHSATDGQQFAAYATGADYTDTSNPLVSTAILQQPGIGPPFHRVDRFTPRTSRYFRIDFNSGPNGTGYYMGVVALGLAFQPTFGHEYGSGRLVTDTGASERLFGGGFGISEGTRAGGWQWTLGDLSDAETRALYRIALDRGNTRSLLVVENPDVTDGIIERIHWGLFAKLDAYERYAPNLTRWSLRIDDWA